MLTYIKEPWLTILKFLVGGLVALLVGMAWGLIIRLINYLFS